MLEQAFKICRQVKEAGGKPYVVGGFIRDYIMGRKSHDIDICVADISFEKLQSLFPDAGVPVGKQFPALIVDGIEVALARTETKICEGHTGFTCETKNITILQDLYRRDLTINAMAMDPSTMEILDPFGGQSDIQRRVLRPVSEAFMEDPLRPVRAARFAAQLKFKLTNELINMSQHMRESLKSLSGERVFEEIVKGLNTDKPSVFVEALNTLQCLNVVLPEIFALKGRIQPPQHHPEGDVFTHVNLALDRGAELNANEKVMFGILVHDLGKAITPDNELPKHINHEALGVPLVHKMCDRLKIPNDFRLVAVTATKEHLNIHRFQELRSITKVRLLDRLKAIHGLDLIEQVTLIAQADAQGRGPLFHSKPYPQRQAVIDAANIYRSINGNQFINTDNKNIAQKLENARTKALSNAIK